MSSPANDLEQVTGAPQRPADRPAWWLPATILVAILGPSLAAHTSAHGFSWTATVLAFFLAINLLVCGWELVLLRYPDDVRADHRLIVDDRDHARLLARIFGRQPDAARPRHWARVWSFYARFDRSYLERGSYGYVIDVCNGLFTLAPSLLILVMMTWQAMPARWLGMLMLVVFHQMLYGTIAYFTAFFLARRGGGHSRRALLLFVGGSNFLWILFPAWGILAAIPLVLTGDYSALN